MNAARFSPFARLLLCGAMLIAAGNLRAAPADDEAAILQLNRDYIQSFLQCDVARYRELLAEDFRCVLSDGRIIGRAEFLQNAAVPPNVKDFQVDEVLVRVIGDTAVVNGLVHYQRADKVRVISRYTDTYARLRGQWRVVAAQFTRVAPPADAPPR